MSITIVDPQKEQTIEINGSKIHYRMPPPSVILDCFFQILGKDFDLSKLTDPTFISQLDQMRIADSIARQCVTGWEDINIPYDIESVVYLPFGIKMEMFSKAMSFLAQNLGGGMIPEPSRSKKKTQIITKSSISKGKIKVPSPTES